MENKYFAEYVPVEGEIKEGCKAIKEDGTLVYVNKAAAAFLCTNWKLTKLFLCSRDIQIGDTFDSANGWNFICTRIDDNKFYSIGGLAGDNEEVGHDKNYCYKKIGLVSPQATWVKKGNVFDRNDFEVRWCNSKGENSLTMKEVDTEEETPVLKAFIKGPCGYFH